jgi:hypothetical protein
MGDNFQDGQQIFFGICIDNEDPDMLGRVRVEPRIQNIAAADKTFNGFDENSKTPEKNGPWSDKDPFIYLPLLPYFINQVPKKGESVMLFYYNTNSKTSRNKFYMLGTFSSPTTINYENYSSSQTRLDAGQINSTKNLPPIKNNDGTYKEESSKGVFVEPVDISLNGRDTADLIIKKDEVLLRAGKHKMFKSGEIPQSDDTRAFLQLSKYYSKLKYGEPTSKTRLISNEKPIKYLIEYDVINPENQFSAFTANLYVYSLRTDEKAYKTLTSNFDYNSELDLTGSTDGVKLVRMINFPIGLNLIELSNQINQRLKSIVTNPKTELLNPTLNLNEQYPFYYRPSKKLRDLTTKFTSTGDLLASANMSLLQILVKISSTDITPGYNLVLNSKLAPELPYSIRKDVYVPSSAEMVNNSVGLMGANQLFLLSHDSVIPGKGKIDIPNTVYGIDQNLVFNEIEPKTSSMVRGEELLELLDLIVRFCLTHVHPYPLLPPSSVTLDGLSTDDLLGKMQEAYTKVLNNNIRIN